MPPFLYLEKDMAEHVTLTDPYIHEPKGASTAPAGSAYVANGAGSGAWTPVLTGPDFGIETLLVGQSTAAAQNPTGLDAPMQIEFGAAQFGPSDPVMLSGTGVITFNQPGLYRVTVAGQVGRAGGAGISKLHARGLRNGVQVIPTHTYFIDNADVLQILSINNWYEVTAGFTLVYQLVRDSTGNNSGGLIKSTPSTAGWLVSPSSFLAVQRYVDA